MWVGVWMCLSTIVNLNAGLTTVQLYRAQVVKDPHSNHQQMETGLIDAPTIIDATLQSLASLQPESLLLSFSYHVCLLQVYRASMTASA